MCSGFNVIIYGKIGRHFMFQIRYFPCYSEKIKLDNMLTVIDFLLVKDFPY